LQTLKGHGFRIDAVAFSPDGKQLVSVSEYNIVHISDVETGMVQILLTPYSILASLVSYMGSPEPIAISLDGRSLAYAEQGWTIRVYDIKTKHEQTLEGWPGPVAIVAFSSDGEQLALAWINTISIWDTDKGAVLRTLEVPLKADDSDSLTFSFNGTQLALARNNTIRILDVDSGTVLQTFEGHASEITAIAFSRDGKQLASGMIDGEIAIWDWDIAASRETPKKNFQCEILALRFLSGCEQVVLLGSDRDFSNLGYTYRSGGSAESWLAVNSRQISLS